MRQKKYEVRVLIGDEVVSSERISLDLLSEYISSLNQFYKNGSMLLFSDEDCPPFPDRETLGSEDVEKIDIRAIPLVRST